MDNTAVLADIQVFAGDEGRVTVVAQDASNQAILESLGGQLGFEIVIEDDEWASQQRSFERTGEIDTLLKALLSGTNHVLSYSDDRVGTVTVLIPGSSNSGFFVGSKTAARPNAEATTASSRQADYTAAPATKTHSRVPRAKTGTNVHQDDEEDELTPRPTAVSNLLRARAQMGAVGVIDRSASQPAPAVSAHDGMPTGVDQAALQRITRQAHQDVKNIAEMLRRAEQQLSVERPE